MLADPDVGGRYSAFTAFGLVPSALAGVDVRALLDEAAAVLADLALDDPSNPALMLGAALAGDRPAAATRSRSTTSSAASLGFGAWAEQLIAESTGKYGTGVLPVVVEPDAPEIQWPAADVLTVRVSADQASIGDETGGPAHVHVAGPLGAQMILWETATAVAGRLLGINPFDQPDVEAAKIAARSLLDAQPEPTPADLVDGGIEIRGVGLSLDGVEDLDGAVEALLAQVRADRVRRGDGLPRPGRRRRDARAGPAFRSRCAPSGRPRSAGVRGSCTPPASSTRAARRSACSCRSPVSRSKISRSPTGRTRSAG